ncbi:MAG TPA: type I-C CRISPR-associated endonuclease Cas1 [Armatimonadetes bacterium]|nr:type I-C CRISPR-associated endonuclease Cas1 [Armatimonadota bacterium]
MKQLLNTLYVMTEGSYLRLERETLVVMVEKEKRMQIPLHHLGSIVCIGRVSMSPSLMARNAEDGRSVTWLNEYGRFQARVEGGINGNILLRQAQFRVADEPVKTLELAKTFIAGKLRNSRQVLQRSARDNPDNEEKELLQKATKPLAINLRNLEHVKSLDSVRGLEGDAARVYFEQFNFMIKPKMRTTFKFSGRNRRPPRDALNALISFLYALLLNDCRSALETVGLDSQPGFLHAVRPGRHALALDLLEEFRAILGDRLALTLINRGQLSKKDFDFREGGSVILNDSGRKTVLTAFQERKKETLNHTLLDQNIEIGLLPLIQARILARYLRGDIEAYLPYLHK